MPHDLKDNNIDKVEKDAKAEFTPYGSEIFKEKLNDTEEVSILHFIADKDEVVPFVKRLQSLVCVLQQARQTLKQQAGNVVH